MRRNSSSLPGTVVGCLFLFVLCGAGGGPRCEAADVIAYDIPAGTTGNQAYAGSLGMDFDVVLDIVVTRLGVFDHESDGLKVPLNVRLFDRNQQLEMALLQFTPEDQGDLIGGSRFKDLPEPLELPAGFQGTISADGYGALEMNGNTGGVDLGLTTNDGGCSLSFVGGGRFGDQTAPGIFPPMPDTGPPNRYASGTFMFTPTETLTPIGGVAYAVPDGAVGNQNFGGNLGLDFNANRALKVTRLGVFDSGGDGLFLPLTARLYYRTTGQELASLTFLPDDAGVFEGGYYFKDLDPPLLLPAGLKATIAASGYGDLEMNGNNGVGNLGQTADNGGCAVSFVGSGRFGAPPDSFPAARDNGVFNMYVAGNFAWEIDPNPPVPPPEPPLGFKAASGDKKVDLSWNASAGPTPATNYHVFRGAALSGPFTKIAETAATNYTDAGLQNEVEVCYYVLPVSQNGVEGYQSAVSCVTPVGPLPEGHHVSYLVQQGTAGNQAYGGALGMDFDVQADIRIHRLGVFDDNSDGLTLPITARVYDRDTQTELARLDFTPDDAGLLIEGSRYKPLETPLDLDAGFHGTMVASGYGGGERNGNQGVGPIAGMTTDTGDCRISFLGGGRFGNDPNVFPPTPDGGPANRYAAGTFDFEGRNAPYTKLPGVPLVTSATGESEVRLSWEPAPATECVLASTSYRVFRSKDGGAFEEIAKPTATAHTDGGLTAGDYCYRVRAVADGGIEGADSPVLCETPGRTIAYKVPGGTVGTVNDGLIVGMDFNVNLDIKLHRLGVFDSGGDGIQEPVLTVRLYDRDLQAEVVSLDFTPDEPGTLLAGSRFLEVVPPIDLPAGFRGSIVVEGYALTELYGSGGPWTFDQGPCSISFVGRGRTGTVPLVLPDLVGVGRPDQYAAGTFQFEAVDIGSPRGAVAYLIPEATIGNQAHTGQLGNDFDVNVDIVVTRLGVFDSASDGLTRDITARVYDRRTQSEVAKLDFTIDDPGELEGGSRFKELDPPLPLAAGFRGTMSAVGYGPGEENGNFLNNTEMPYTTDDGGCAIIFVGGGRFGNGPPSPTDTFPTFLDGGPVNRYAAGTFEFEIAGEQPGGAFRRGDVDNNKVIEITDPVQLLSFLFLGGGTPACMDAADFDDSGILDITDAVNNLNYQFLGGALPGAPGPFNCGPDPTNDDLDCKAECQ